MDHSIQLVVGLGNPGKDYARTRHNAGFWVVEELALRHGGEFNDERKFHGRVAKATVAGVELRLLEPQTYMNRSGLAVRSLVDYLKLTPEQVLVVHDEIDLPVGELRLKWEGGHGGHNGLRDLHQHLGKDYRRLRVGVGRPPSKAEGIDHVLERPGKAEQLILDEAVQRAADAIEQVMREGMEPAMQALHSKIKDESDSE
jgi:PTH1 family peptidyl-tRNA hydrolase